MTLALLRLWNAAHDLIYVLATARPGGFAAFAAGYFRTHLFLLVGA
jgi:hypothetical protein